MKGSVHAKSLGYEVSYVKNAVEGDGDDYDFKRYACPNFMNDGVKASCQLMEGLPATGTCTDEQKQKWFETVFKTLGGPSPNLRMHIMKNAEIKECADASAVTQSIGGTACPLTNAPGAPEVPQCA